MGLRFRKSFKIAPGVKVNLNKKSAGVTIGTRGAHYTVNTSGKRTASVGLPGTGLSYSTSSGGKKKGGTRKATKKDIFNKVVAVVIAIAAIACTAGAIKTALDKKAASAPAAVTTQASAAAEIPSAAAGTIVSDAAASSASDASGSGGSASVVPASDASGSGGSASAVPASDTSGSGGSASASSASDASDASDAAQDMVWISASGKKYHSKPDCSGMENATEVTRQEALDMGKEACKRCNP